MSDDSNEKNSPLIEFLKTMGIVLGVPIALFTIINGFFEQPTASLFVAIITGIVLSIWLAYSRKIDFSYLVIAWLSFAVIILLGFVIWPKTMTFEGFVNYSDGKPVVNEIVQFFDYTGRTYETRTDVTGFYQFVDVPTGRYRIRVRTTEIQGETKGVLVRVVQQSISVSTDAANILTPTPTSTSTPVPTNAPTNAATPQETTVVPTPTSINTVIPTQIPDPLPPTPIDEYQLKGKVVTVLGSFSGSDVDLFKKSMRPFEERTGIKVEYIESAEYDAELTQGIQKGTPPDLADFPQPGVLANFVNQGSVVDLSSFLDETYLKQQYDQSWLDMATIDGQVVGVWHRANLKSLVWYPVPAFEQAGYNIPETWDEMIKLSDQIIADGHRPWCIGDESGEASGWLATDWIEDIMLRTTSPQEYDKWVKGELKFNSPEVRRAMEIMGQIWFGQKYVYGGRQAIETTFFGDAITPMFNNPPRCWFHRQASFITAFFPSSVKVGRDVDYFQLPPIDPEYGKPVLFDGDIFAMFNDRPEVRELVKYLTTGESVRAWVEAGSTLSPHKDADLDWYPTPIERGYVEILMNADTIRFDGSDMMPGEVGAGSFWKGVRDYVNGRDLDTVLNEIDASWP